MDAPRRPRLGTLRRRRVVALLLLAACATPTSDRRDARADTPGASTDRPTSRATAADLAAGPMLGYAEMTATVIWAQTRAPADVQVRFWPEGRPGEARLSPVASTSRAGDLIAAIRLEDLAQGARYGYEVYVDGRRHATPFATTFTTRPPWRYRGPDREHPHAPPEFTFLFGSCLYVNEVGFDRPGEPYGGDFEILDAMVAERPAFMVWLGDNVYYRDADWLTEGAMRHRYAHTRAHPGLQPLLATTHHYATWDDHDFGPNDSDRTFRLREAALEIFADYWPAVQYGSADARGTFQRFEWGDVEFFMLDDRYHRAPNAMAAGPDKQMLGEAQRRWLIEGLVNSAATFKIVVCGTQMVNPLVPYEAFALFPDERRLLLDELRAADVDGVLFLSGDRHHTELIRLERDGTYPLYDFTSSPLTARAYLGHESELDHPDRVTDTLIDERSYGRVRVLGPQGARRLELSAHAVDGRVLWTHVIEAAELR